MSPVRESNTWSVATGDGSPGHLWHKIMLRRRKFPRNVFLRSGECVEENILTLTGMKGIRLCIAMRKCTPCSCYRPGSSRFLPTKHGYTSCFDFPVLIALQCSFLSFYHFLNDKLKDLLSRRSSETEDKSEKPLTHLTTLYRWSTNNIIVGTLYGNLSRLSRYKHSN